MTREEFRRLKLYDWIKTGLKTPPRMIVSTLEKERGTVAITLIKLRPSRYDNRHTVYNDNDCRTFQKVEPTEAMKEEYRNSMRIWPEAWKREDLPLKPDTTFRQEYMNEPIEKPTSE